MGNVAKAVANDIATVYPALVPEWDTDANGGLLPTLASASGKNKFAWRCKQGHTWVANVYDRGRGHGCPVCAGIKVWPGYNDMSTTHPELAAEFDPAKNDGLSPEDVIAGSNKKLWWKCDFGHSWQSRSADRVKGSGCPVCSGRKVLAGYNDLATTNPGLASEWNYKLNGGITPEQVKAGSRAKYWWTCPEVHDYLASTNDRNRGSGCSLRRGKTVVPGINDLATTHHALAGEWDYEKNGQATPTNTYAGTKAKFWWRCGKGHNWQASLASRSVRGDGCPYCAGMQAWTGDNDMNTTHPEIASEWHPTRNGDLTPYQVLAGTNQKIWWICNLGHEWQTQGNMRYRGHGCPFCGNKQVLEGYNDLATTHPQLAAEWHPTKNFPETPQEVVAGTKKKIWWKCEQGHEWLATGGDRAFQRQGCPVCGNSLVLEGYNDMATTHAGLAAEWHPTKNGDLTPKHVVVGTSKRIWWQCKEGHEWRTAGSARASGTGCPTCTSFGFDPNKSSVLYFIANRELYARKVGITNVGTRRLDKFAKLGWHQILTIEHNDGSLVRAVEKTIFEWLRVELEMPRFLASDDMGSSAGWTETFSEDGPSDFEVITKIKTTFDILTAGIEETPEQ